MERDTIVDFWQNQKVFDRLDGYENRIVGCGSTILYAKITFKKTTQANLEYFRINDSLFHFIGYFPNGDTKSIGTYLLKDEIIGTDTVVIESFPSGHMYYCVYYFKKIIKTGHWIEYENSIDLANRWKGEYINGRRIGVWSQEAFEFNMGYEIQRIDHTRDSTKSFYLKNLVNQWPYDSLYTFIRGRWAPWSCEGENSPRMLYRKCHLYNKEYQDDCITDPNGRYLEFSANGQFARMKSSTCGKFHEKDTKGNWMISEEATGTYIYIRFSNSSTWKLKLIYLDRDGNLITERV
jgi:hypothetical protein